MTAHLAVEQALMDEEEFITEEDLIVMNQDGRVEIFDGQPVEAAAMGGLEINAAANLYDLLRPVVKKSKSGFLFPDGLIYLMWMEGKSLKGAYIPDLSFIRKANIVKGWKHIGNYPGAPDLAVEVVSSGDDAPKVLRKVRGYLQRGTEEVWLIFPEVKELHQYRKDRRSIEVFAEGDTFDAGTFFPGVKIVIADLFTLPELE